MIKDIAVSLSVGVPRDVAAEYAISVAEAFGAHLAGIAFAYEPVVPSSVMGGISVDFIDAQRAESTRRAKEAMARFDEATRRAGLSAESRLIGATLADAASEFAAIARRFDLSVVAQAQGGKLAPEELMIEAALFDSGRPVIVVPYVQKAPMKLDTTLVCWDGSRTAARAIADAMPLLARAKTVQVVIIATERAKSDEVPGADLGQHLARHGLKIDVKRIVSGLDVPNAILSHAADVSADFIVMGGYGHSRLREFVLGGATRGILASMTAPVLMSH